MTTEGREPSRYFVAAVIWSLLGLMIWSAAVLPTPGRSQPPGSRPPNEAVLTPPTSDEKGNIPVKAFLFLDDALNPVMMPRMSFEELERLRNIEAGIDSPTQQYSFDSLEINGTTEEGRCELDVALRLTVESTEGRWTAIPLRMNNFHRLGPADVSGVDDHRITSADDGSGYVLWVKASQSQKVLVEMRVVSRVASAPTRSVDFVLPDVPSTIRLVAGQANASAEVVGRGDEVVQTEAVLGGRTRMIVESGGGMFTLKWGSATRTTDTTPVVEVESSVTVDWDSPQDLPLASIQMTISNLRDNLSSFDIRLPANAVLLDTPSIGSTASEIEVSSPIAEPDGDRIRVLIPEQERQQRIDLSFDLQLSSNDDPSTTALEMQVPQVIGALRQRGEIQVRTSSDYRLRWRSSQWVQSMLSTTAEATETSRNQTFRFDRASFKLPLWLSAKQRQLRVSSDTQVSLLDGLASLEMSVDVTGQSSDGRGLQIDMAQWQLRSIIDMDSGTQLDSYAAENNIEIELASRGSDETFPIKIRAERRLVDGADRVAFPLPRIVKSDDNLLVQSATLQIRSDGRRSLVINLDESTGLDPIADKSDSDLVEPTLRRFRILPPDTSARVSGVIVDQPPRITLATESHVTLDAGVITTNVDWTVSSLLSLEGRLPIRIASAPVPSVPDQAPSPSNEPTQGGTSQPPAANGAVSGPGETKGATPAETSVQASGLDIAGVDGPGTGTNSSSAVANPSLGVNGNGVLQTPASESTIGGPVIVPGVTMLTDSSLELSRWAVTVDGAAATLEPGEDGAVVIVSDRLLDGTMSIRFRHVQPVNRTTAGTEVQLVPLPRPAIGDVSIVGGLRVRLQGDASAEIITASEKLGDDASQSEVSYRDIVLESLPREPLRLRLRPRSQLDRSRELTIRRAVLRTVVGRMTRHEQLIATVEGGESLRVTLPIDAAEVAVQATVDGMPTSVDRDGRLLIVPVPVSGIEHTIDLRLWVSEATASSVVAIAPMIKLPPTIDQLYWQVLAPGDSHVLWASPTASRAMVWRFDRWRLYREPSRSDRVLNQWAGGMDQERLPSGNSYLYVGSDVNSFRVLLVSRGVLWLVTGAMMLLASALLLYIPSLRNPLSAVVVAIGLAGVLVIAPDAAVMLGQLGMIASVLVVVMLGIRSLITPRPSVRVLSSTRSPSRREPSTRTLVRQVESSPRGTEEPLEELAETQSLPTVPTTSEVSS